MAASSLLGAALLARQLRVRPYETSRLQYCPCLCKIPAAISSLEVISKSIGSSSCAQLHISRELMVAIDAAKVALQTGFKRTNPRTDLFKVRQVCETWRILQSGLRKQFTASLKPRWHLTLDLLLVARQVLKFQHIDWWCADATSTQKRYLRCRRFRSS